MINDFITRGPLRPLAEYAQFIIYKLIDIPGSTKKDKIPINYKTGQKCDAHSAENWLSASAAIEEANAWVRLMGAGYGVGFVFTENDPFFFLDIDQCVAGNQWAPVAQELLLRFRGAAVEVSSSQRGLHIIGRARVDHARTRDDKKLNLELYFNKRFVALTGYQLQGDANYNCQAGVEILVNEHFKKSDNSRGTEWTTEAVPEWNGPADDNELIKRALRSKSVKNVFGGSASFANLWENNIEILAQAYPSPDAEKPYNQSSADAALAQHLAFWTGNNCARMLELMSQSKLTREKWGREDYLQRTILHACGGQKSWLNDKPVETLEKPATSNLELLKPRLVEGNTFLSIPEQLKLFEGCCYVLDAHSILIPGGQLLKPDQFRTVYGGFTFPMDNANERTSRNAWEAFSESQAFRKKTANSTCFKPQLKFGEIIEQDGMTFVNTFWPVKTPRLRGDVTPFLIHLEKLFPDTRDNHIISCYLAALVQHQGIKFTWCPLIQGVEGNGKSLINRCLEFAIGQRYTHSPKSKQISDKFNGFMRSTILITVEDLFTPSNDAEMFEVFKPMIDGKRIEIENKGRDRAMTDICCNFILNSNHKTAIKKTQNERRIAPFFTPQQHKEDLNVWGMTSNYFFNFHRWLSEQDGLAIVNNYLCEYKIADEFNPATHCRYAPTTSSTEIAIQEAIGSAEQHILEAIEQGLPGFRGGWVSSIAIDRLLQDMNFKHLLAPNKRRGLMQSIGYDWHSGLPAGRVLTTVFPDGAKPKLFIKPTHRHSVLTDPAAIARLYSEAQRED